MMDLWTQLPRGESGDSPDSGAISTQVVDGFSPARARDTKSPARAILTGSSWANQVRSGPYEIGRGDPPFARSWVPSPNGNGNAPRLGQVALQHTPVSRPPRLTPRTS